MISSTFTAEIGNGQRETRTVVGTVTVEEFVHRTSEQTACNWREITVPAGTYDVVLTRRGDALVTFPGIKTDEHFVNRLFGSSSLAAKHGIGEPDTAHWQMYGYSVAEKFATDPAWELATDWRVEMRTEHYADGRAYKAYGLRQQGGA